MSDLKYFEVAGVELHDAKVSIADGVHEPHLSVYDEDYLPENYRIMVAIDSNAVLYMRTYSVEKNQEIKEEEYEYQTIYNGSYSIYPKGD